MWSTGDWSRRSVFNQLQLPKGLFRETWKDAVAILKTAEHKRMDKIFQVLLR